MFIHVLSLVLCDLFPKMDVGRQKTTLVKDLMPFLEWCVDTVGASIASEVLTSVYAKGLICWPLRLTIWYGEQGFPSSGTWKSET